MILNNLYFNSTKIGNRIRFINSEEIVEKVKSKQLKNRQKCVKIIFSQEVKDDNEKVVVKEVFKESYQLV